MGIRESEKLEHLRVNPGEKKLTDVTTSMKK